MNPELLPAACQMTSVTMVEFDLQQVFQLNLAGIVDDEFVVDQLRIGVLLFLNSLSNRHNSFVIPAQIIHKFQFSNFLFNFNFQLSIQL
jgi:hypothetical protein